MIEIPLFRLYGEDDPEIEERIQPRLTLRSWDSLIYDDKSILFQTLVNKGWFDYTNNKNLSYCNEAAIRSVEYLNALYLRVPPGKNLFNHVPEINERFPYRDFRVIEAGMEDFQEILVNGVPGALVLRMLSKYLSVHISGKNLDDAEKMEDCEARKELIDTAYGKFDKLAAQLNQIFEKFCINVLVTRNGFVPRQDNKINREIYQPVLSVLSDPKWKSVSDNLADMFNDYQAQKYPEVITKAHSTLQRFLQILVGNEGRTAKGEFKHLFARAKTKSVISDNQFTLEIVKVFGSYISSERVNKSTAKPTKQHTKPSDALLVMNTLMVFLQHCLQNTEQHYR